MPTFLATNEENLTTNKHSKRSGNRSRKWLARDSPMFYSYQAGKGKCAFSCLLIKRRVMSRAGGEGGGGGRVLSYMGYIGTCRGIEIRVSFFTLLLLCSWFGH